ncbi:hypothetical protein A2380_03595 [candidate division WWE3 bacterium RIFOXYB1_FULL_43_24]|uniref:RND-like protein efflux transporter n=2 Tax=Katanobacteria TaxID=422282 RepID=A0A0G0YQ99_UNCKA|nr:MAG: RND-like protein efflux transporter [candidate division WWE3 bacterium GW2011_GWA1_42_12]KKS34384.1 MAG: RND-like protein efflux transporter [candidate division WWE3 bacterium GW2011_GWD1_42_14]KKS38842.1 MAG: RND-like protein efflux transporter [candidate division WWE3 bacterium GW2011_GWF1_42_14]KKS40540.1 MAG: RND-like protein efflux transporter [candidate division WWE3 bacterium GW2011_GWE1_42_16]KKS66951.1 MAG: RND-like protein efflux transporter [candidate division WWE3 bacterium 
MKKYLKYILIAALVAVGAYLLFFRGSDSKSSEVAISEYKVKKGDIIVGFESEGTFVTDIVEPSFVSSGKINSINVSIGDEVKSGDLLATLESSEDYYSMLSAKAIYEKAVAAHHAFEATYNKLDKSGFEYEDVKNYEEQENQLREASKSAESLYNKSINALRKNSLYCPIEGTVIDIYFNEGESVQNQNQSNPIMAILPKEKTVYVESYVEDLDISKVKKDMNAKFIPDAIDKEYSGKVVFISPKSVTDNNGLVTYKVRIALDGTAELYDGFIGSVQFLSKSAENVLVIPNKAVRMIEGTQYVFEYPDTTKKIKVVTGLTDGTNVEVVEGLNENDTIAITE